MDTPPPDSSSVPVGVSARRSSVSERVYLHAIIDCCTREITSWSLELRCRDDEAIACVEAALVARGIRTGQLTLGTDNGSQFTSRDFRRHLSARGITHRRGG